MNVKWEKCKWEKCEWEKYKWEQHEWENVNEKMWKKKYRNYKRSRKMVLNSKIDYILCVWQKEQLSYYSLCKWSCFNLLCISSLDEMFSQL